MAKQDELRIKAVLDTEEFDTSLDGMKQEFASLEKQLGSSLLSPKDQKAVLARMGTLKKGIDGFNLQIDALGKQSGFEQLAQTVTPMIGAFTAAGSVLQLFGVENEKLNQIIQQTQSLTIGLLALQDLSNLKNLKGLFLLRVEKIKALVIDKLTFKNTVKQAVANKVVAASQAKVGLATKIATKAQWLWNAAITANPIVALVVAVAALVAGIIILIKWLGDSTDAYTEQDKAIDGVYIRNEELRESYNESVRDLQKLNLEYENITGTLSDYEYQMALVNLELERNLELSEADRLKALDEALEDNITFWDNLVGFAALKLGAYGFLVKRVDKIFERGAKNRKEINDTFNKEQEALLKAHNIKILKLNKTHNKSIIADEKDLTKKLLEEQKKRQDRLLKGLSDLNIAYIKSIENDQERELTQIEYAFDTLVQKIVEEQIKAAAEILTSLDLLADEEGISFLESIVDFTDEDIEKFDEKTQTLLKVYRIGQLRIKYEAINFANDREAIIDKYNKDEIDKAKEHQEKLLQIEIDGRQEIQDILEKRASISDAEADNLKRKTDQIDGFNKFSIKKEKQAEREKLDIQKKSIDDYYKFRIQTAIDNDDFSEAVLLGEQFEAEMVDLETSFKDRWDGFSQNVVSAIADMTGMISAAVLEVFSRDVLNQFDLLNKRLQEETDSTLNSLDALRDADLISEEEHEKRSLAAQEEADRKENELRIKQAKAEKRMAIFQILIDTAIAIAKSWGQGGGLFGAPIAAIAAIQGALQLGVVASSPIPEFARGGKLGGSRHAFGGTMVEAEQGEFVVNRNSVAQPGVEALLQMINQNGNNDSGTYNTSDGSTDANVIQQIVQETVRGITSIPVTNLESEYTNVQRKVKSIETRATW